MKIGRRLLPLALLAALLAAGCGAGEDDAAGEIHSGEGSTFEEATLSLTTGQGGRGSSEGTLREGTSEGGNAVLRLEGDPRTTFSGICTVEGEAQVLTGGVPKTFTFDLDRGSLECRIQKQDSGRGSLNAVLSVDDSTRSSQQTDRRGGTLRLSYASSGG